MRKHIKVTLLVAAIGACSSLPADAPEPKSTDFFFNYDRSSLRDSVSRDRMYDNLTRKAELHCADAGDLDEVTNCTSSMIARTVEGIADERLIQHHVQNTGSDPSTRVTASDFVFHFTDDEVDSFAATGRLYNRLESEAEAFCSGRAMVGENQNCAGAIMDRLVVGVDDRKLTRQHRRETGKGTVIVSDPIFLDEREKP